MFLSYTFHLVMPAVAWTDLLMFCYSISHPDQVLLWQDMSAIKTNILRRMDTSPAAVRVVCIKFVQKVVQVQTPGVIADPRVSCFQKIGVRMDGLTECRDLIVTRYRSHLSLETILCCQSRTSKLKHPVCWIDY